jgi:hypothetical protein
MFPNVRLMIAAMIFSIAAIGGGLGAFAAFRVNHEPFARLPSDDPPLQLVYYNAASPSVTDAIPAPFGVRFGVTAPKLAGTGVDAATFKALVPATPADATTGTPLPNAADSDTARDANPNGEAVTATESPADQSALTDRTVQDSKVAPGLAPRATVMTEAMTGRRGSRHLRLARTSYSHKAQASAVAQATDQDSGFSQRGFRTAPTALQQHPAKSFRVAR